MTSAKIVSLKGNLVTLKLDEPLNIERIKTLYSNNSDNILADLIINDPRKFSTKQRNLFFALLKDINLWSGTGQVYLKEYFYDQYTVTTFGDEISLNNQSQNTISEVTRLIEIVIEFIFKNNIPVSKAYNLLPKKEAYWAYFCCKYRKCMECGLKADIHHVDALGMGSNRIKAHHLRHHFMALCRTHHQEIEQIGRQAFSNKYHMPANGIKLDLETFKILKIRGNYEEEETSNGTTKNVQQQNNE